MNLYDISSIDCNKKNKIKIHDLYNNILINKFVHGNKYKNTAKSSAKHVDPQLSYVLKN